MHYRDVYSLSSIHHKKKHPFNANNAVVSHKEYTRFDVNQSGILIDRDAAMKVKRTQKLLPTNNIYVKKCKSTRFRADTKERQVHRNHRLGAWIELIFGVLLLSMGIQVIGSAQHSLISHVVCRDDVCLIQIYTFSTFMLGRPSSRYGTRGRDLRERVCSSCDCKTMEKCLPWQTVA